MRGIHTSTRPLLLVVVQASYARGARGAPPGAAGWARRTPGDQADRTCPERFSITEIKRVIGTLREMNGADTSRPSLSPFTVWFAGSAMRRTDATTRKLVRAGLLRAVSRPTREDEAVRDL